MTVTVYASISRKEWAEYKRPLAAAIAAVGIEATLQNRCSDPSEVDYIVYSPAGPVTDFSPFTRTKAVLSLWAGVERIIGNETLTQPLARLVDPGLTQGMIEYVTAHVLRHHLGIDRYLGTSEWVPKVPPLAQHRRVAVLGLGALGSACAKSLVGLGFDVLGWSRRAKEIPGVRCRHGEDGLSQTLSEAEILVLLLPRTPETENLLTSERLDELPRGAVVINPGRGALIDDEALLAALDEGQVGHATLDTFRVEPLPKDHPYWRHPHVTITPHIAAPTRPETAAKVIAENIQRGEMGMAFWHLVDRSAGY